jgi:predicted outer membrane repeat protein
MVIYLSMYILLLLLCHHKLSAQTTIAAGNVSGTWTKKGSPYLITGDINIPEGKNLIIQPGVKVKFKGSYNINVQGSISAIGTVNDTIAFTLSDTNGFNNDYKIGWNGIHFDPRPIIWDTIRFTMTDDEEIKKEINEKLQKGLIDTSTKIILALQGPDLVNDKSTVNYGKLNKRASRLAYCRFEYGNATGRLRPYIFGGAVYIYRYSNLVISNSVFENNRAYAGGAIYCKEAAPVIIDNVIRNCQAVSSGGAMVFIHSGAILLGNQITYNNSGYNGGGILLYESCPYMLSNIMLSNTAVNSGGALYIERKTGQVITTGDYRVNENTKISQDVLSMNVNLSKDIIKNTNSSNGRFLNNLICNNYAKNGGGVGLSATAPEFTNNTICNNSAESTGGGFYSFYSAPVITNSIIYGNQDRVKGGQQMYFLGKSSLKIKYSNIESGISGITKDSACSMSLDYSNIQNNPPLFVNPDDYDYSLQTGSPCIDAGKTDTTSLRMASLDLNEQNRVNNNIIDMGAIEYADQGRNSLKSTQDSSEFNNVNEFLRETVYNLYPNPSSGRFSIVIYNNQYTSIRVYVFSHTGQRVYDKLFVTESFVEETVDLEGSPSGIYEVQVSSGDKIIYHDEIIIE